MSATLRDSDTFKYQPLQFPDSIRILHLQPSLDSSAHSSQQIRANLIHTTLSECDVDLVNHYIALSYVWGSTENKDILVDEQIFAITSNLRDALFYLQQSNKVLPVWADAICINQADVKERNGQVRMTGLIYSIARHTVIFLGEETSHIDKLLQHISDLDSKERARAMHLIQEDSISSVIAPTQETIFHATKDLLNRQWFKRLWVFQELVISRDPWIQCGCHRLKVKSLVEFFRAKKLEFSEMRTRPPYSFPPEHYEQDFKTLEFLSGERMRYRGAIGRNPQLNLYDILRSRRGVGMADPRDMVFGHLGVAGLPVPAHTPRISFPVDYGSNVADTFMDVAKKIID